MDGENIVQKIKNRHDRILLYELYARVMFFQSLFFVPSKLPAITSSSARIRILAPRFLLLLKMVVGL